MNKIDLKDLQSVKDYPCISILMPTHKSFPETKQDPIRLKNLINDVKHKLESEFSQEEVTPLLNKLDELILGIDYNHTLGGIALFVNKDYAQRFDLPFKVRERIAIEESFIIRDLVFAGKRLSPYFVLVLSDMRARLFSGAGKEIEEVSDDCFPLTNKYPGVLDADNSNLLKEVTTVNQEDRKRFMKEADMCISKYNSEKLPVVVTGSPGNLSVFKEVSTQNIVCEINVLLENSPAPQILDSIWDEVKEAFKKKRAENLKELDDAIGARKYTTGLSEVWKLAQEGRGATLFVEKNFHCPAKIENGEILPLENENSGTMDFEDAVDEIMDAVISKGGKITITEDEELAQHGRIAMTLRY